MTKKNEDIADKIDILRNSQVVQNGTNWREDAEANKNARLLRGIKKKQLVRDRSQ